MARRRSRDGQRRTKRGQGSRRARAPEPLQEVQIEVDLDGGTLPFPKNWQRAFGSGHAQLATRADWQKQLRRSVGELGLRGVRMHGWLDDDMSVVPTSGTYRFFNVDTVLDFLVETGVAPIVELSFMPSALAKNKSRHAFANSGGIKGVISEPSSYNEWYELVAAFASHLLRRYGAGELSKWAFEVWNEMWGVPYPDAYLPLYNASAHALKAVHPALRVGGPSSAKLQHIPELIRAARKHRIPLDFVSSHHYPSDPSCHYAGYGPNVMDAECFSKDILAAAELAASAGKPFLLTEYKEGLHGGPGTGFGGSHSDRAYAAAFVMHTVPLLSRLEAVSWWTFSDIFEENWMIGRPFYGGYGLLTVHGIAKPAYRAFQLLAGAGTTRLEAVRVVDPAPGYMNATTISALVTRGSAFGDGRELQLFLTNFGPERGATTAPWTPVARNVSVTLGPRAGARHPHDPWPRSGRDTWPELVLEQRIDDQATAPLAAWKSMGEPDYPTTEQLARLAAASEMPSRWVALTALSSCSAVLTVELPPQGVAHIRIPSPPLCALAAFPHS